VASVERITIDAAHQSYVVERVTPVELLFVDANIYLRFYDSSQGEYKKLLKTLVEVKDRIFITTQLVDEVNRNKLDVFLSSCSGEVVEVPSKQRHLPEHFDSRADTSIHEWNKDREELEGKSKELRQRKITIYASLLSEIEHSQDEVSSELNKVFASARRPTPKQMERGILRKQVGNPPGKRQDPLGDQLSWEQLLDDITEVTHLWIISNDSDYFNEYNKKCYLNPFLDSEVRRVARKLVSLKCFSTLSMGLQDFNNLLSMKLSSIPAGDELVTISEREKEPSLTGYSTGSTGAIPTYSGIQDLLLPIGWQPSCPTCGSFSHVQGPVTTVIGAGHFKDAYVCQKCGTQWERLRSSGLLDAGVQ
jgi:hypothetical protein